MSFSSSPRPNVFESCATVYQQWRKVDNISFKHIRQGTQRSDRRFALVHSTSAYFLDFMQSVFCNVQPTPLSNHLAAMLRRLDLFQQVGAELHNSIILSQLLTIFASTLLPPLS